LIDIDCSLFYVTIFFLLIQDTDRKTASNATSLLTSILNFNFITTLVVVEYYLQFTKTLSVTLQSVDCDLLIALSESQDLVSMLKTKRQDSFFPQLFKIAYDLASELDVDIRMPRVVGRQPYRANGPSESVEEHFRINLHNPFLDHLIAELQTRLLNASDRVQAERLLPQNVGTLTDIQWNKLKDTYSSFVCLLDIDIELERWKFKWRNISDKKYRIEDCIPATKDLYPNLHKIFIILFTMPVSTATAERSFSTLKRLKTYLRSTMGSDRLTGLALMHINRHFEINISQVLKEFDSSGHRRIAMAFEKNSSETEETS